MRLRTWFLMALTVGCGRTELQVGECASFGFEEADADVVDPSFSGPLGGPSVITNPNVYSTRGPTLDASGLNGMPVQAEVAAWVDGNWTWPTYHHVETGDECEDSPSQLLRDADVGLTLGDDEVDAVPGTLFTRITYGALDDPSEPLVVDDATIEVRMAPSLNGDGSSPTYVPFFAPGIAAILDAALLATLPEGAVLHPDGPAEGFIDLDLRWTLGQGVEERPVPGNLDLAERGSFTYVVQAEVDEVVEAHTLRISFDLVDAP